MIFATIAVFIVGYFGFQVISVLLGHKFDLVTRIGAGSIFGIVFSAWGFFICSVFYPLNKIHGVVHLFVMYVISHVINVLRKPKNVNGQPLIIIGFSVVIPSIFLAFFFKTGLLHNQKITKGAAYGDLPFHMNLISSFSYGCNSQRKSIFDLKSPFFAHEKLAYPFIPNFYSSVLISCFGASMHVSIVLPSIIFGFSLCAIFSHLVYCFTQSNFITCISPWLFLLTGGLGFTRWFNKDYRNEFQIDYVHYWGGERNEYWFQSIIHILLPQRASLFSLPFAWFTILILMKSDSSLDYRSFFAAGLFVASLPQLQPHSVIALAQWGIIYAIISFPWKYRSSWISVIKNYATLGSVAVILGIPQIIPFLDRTKPGFFKLSPIWKGENNRNFFSLWFYGLGAIFVLSIFVVPFILEKRQHMFYIPSFFVFIVSNFVWYQPWHMDNTKVFNAGWIPISLSGISYLFVYLYKKLKASGVIISLSLFVLCTASGFLAVSKSASLQYSLWRHAETPYEIADFVKKNTDPQSVWITDSVHTHPVVTLAGRQTLVGYRGWLISHGINDDERLKVISGLKKNPDNTEAVDKFGVDYVCLMKSNEYAIEFAPNISLGKWKVIYQSYNYKIFKRLK